MSKLSYCCKIEYDNPSDEQKLRETLILERDAFNMASQCQFGGKHCIKELHAKAYRKIRNAIPQLPAGVVTQVERACLHTYRSIKSKGHNIDKPFIKKNLSIQYNAITYTKKKDWYRISTHSKRITVRPQLYPLIEKMFASYEYSDPLVFERNGTLYISFMFTVPDSPITENISCGVDLGIRRFAATSEGKIFIDREFNKRKRKLRYLKSRLKSKGTKSAKRHLKKIQHSEKNANTNFTHHLSKQIIQSTNSTILVLEDLTGIKDKRKRKIPKWIKFKGVSQASFYTLRLFLTYKAPLYGKRVVTVSPYNTSQIDHRTGRADKSKRKGCRYYSKRRLVFDADINAAINIARRAKHPVSCCKALDGQVAVNQPIVGIGPLGLPTSCFTIETTVVQGC